MLKSSSYGKKAAVMNLPVVTSTSNILIFTALNAAYN